mmetsp:Transcript_651/g.1395  ORF Transcript_651/g.1395 Transcript_651/m.1395 type:complete len:589 (+) Transcript_651:110-1876(+)|eukprot:CAMPEP_0115245102 /NCGR_PEP_ID=MMETSP0270-20121206/40334_1 /TAXON_ID=71861 /ORGANISM="Scrippsiella trochoidea, Strain CCMP3099" /LENGTH=588 /DNA_ID=CAMNT_0002660267 /DNA_START=35 /DNA_END=1801 /DNA_ORIENTATION=-
MAAHWGCVQGPCRRLLICYLAAAAHAAGGAAHDSEAAVASRGHQLLQTQLAVGRSGSPEASDDTGSTSRTSREKHPTKLATGTLALTCLMTPVLLQLAVRGFARLIFTGHGGKGHCSGRRDARELSKILTAFDAFTSASSLAVEGACHAATLALLPNLAGGRSTASVLVWTRPVVGVTAATLLPLLFYKGRSRDGRLGTAAGLALLVASCLGLAWARALWWAIAARAMGAIGSALVLGSAVHTAVSQLPRRRIGWRLNGAMYGLAVGTSGAPLLGSALSTFYDGDVQWMLLGLASGAGVACVAHLSVSGWVVEQENSRSLSGSDNQVCGNVSAMFAAVGNLAQDARSRLLLVVCGVSAAALSLHSTLLPLFLRSDLGLSGGSVDYLGEGPSGGAAMGVALLLCGLLVDFLPEPTAAAGLVGMSAIGALGLRAIAIGRGAAMPNLTSIGLLASQSSIGGLLGLALPLLMRRLAAMRRCAMVDGPCQEYSAEAELVSGGAVVSGAVSAAWLLGEGLATCAQTLLWPVLGLEGLVLTLAVGLVALAAAVLATRGWFRGGGFTSGVKEEQVPCLRAGRATDKLAAAKLAGTW